MTKFDIQFHQKQPQNLDAVMINQWLLLSAHSHLLLCHCSPKLCELPSQKLFQLVEKGTKIHYSNYDFPSSSGSKPRLGKT